MYSIIINQAGADESAIAGIYQSWANQAEVIVIGEKIPTVIAQQHRLAAADRSLADNLRLAAGMAKGSRLILVDSSAMGADLPLAEILAAEATAPVLYYPLQIGDDRLELSDLSIDTLVAAIMNEALWPTVILNIDPQILSEIKDLEAETLNELSAKLIIGAVAAHLEVDRANVLIEMAADALSIDNKARAGRLSQAVNCCNIEDIFPNHAWAAHEEESAAACYHTLAAHFLRLGDLSTAKQCLGFSDQLEDSPRSLALKALISMASGETLGAVANMVSSLQQYEGRKTKRNGDHYISFDPANLEQVNQELNAGLNALNRRDNESALGHFAAAVFNFDSFFGENGLDRIVH